MAKDLQHGAEDLRQALPLQTFSEEDQHQAARFVAAIARVGTIAPLVVAALVLVEAEPDWPTAITLGVTSGLCYVAAWQVYRGAVQTAGWIVLLAGIACNTLLVFTGNTRGFGDIGMMLYPVLVAIGSLFLDRRGNLIALGWIMAALGSILAAELSGFLGPRSGPKAIVADFGFAVVIVVVSAVTSRLLANSLRRSVARTRRKEEALARANRLLETEVTERERLIEMLDVANRQLAAEAGERERLIQELEDRNVELERFTYTVSHDLKSPLVTIGGFLGYLEKHVASGDLGGFRDDLERVERARAKMARLLDELLELSRIGRMMGEPEDVPFAAVVGEALEAVAGSLSARGLEVIVEEHLPIVHGDRVRLVEVVQNLLENAAKFTRRTVEPRIEIGVRDGGAPPVFFVRDNGIGIEPDYHERVFGLFEKLNPRNEGSGVGLALARRIVECHGGRIWVESEGAGRGTTFCFTLASGAGLDGDGGSREPNGPAIRQQS